MATPSQMLELGTSLPVFFLPDVISGRIVSSTDHAGRVLVVAFICNHCPFVKHIRSGLADFGRWCDEQDVPLLAISSNDPVAYPVDAPPGMQDEAAQAGYTFPYLFDESQDVAKAFCAACTPEFYVFGKDAKLAYRGQFDDSRPQNAIPVTGKDVRDAVQALLDARRPANDQKPSIGCNIKWKAGNAPAYF